MFCLDMLSNEIRLYDKNCNLLTKIIPEACKDHEELIIINFHFAEKCQRVKLKY